MTHVASRKRCADGPLPLDSPTKLPRVASLTPAAVTAFVAAALGEPRLPQFVKQLPPPMSEPEERKPTPTLPPPPRRFPATKTTTPKPLPAPTAATPPRPKSLIIHASKWRSITELTDASSVASSSRLTLDSTVSSLSNDSGTDRPSSATSATSTWSGPHNYMAGYSPVHPLDGPSYSPKPKPKPVKKKRPHIFDKQHKIGLAGKKQEIKEELKRLEAHRKRYAPIALKQGYSEDWSDFAVTAGQAVYQDEPEKVEGAVVGLFEKRFSEAVESVLNAPKPQKPFTPTIEQAQRALRAKDAYIENRLRPPRPTLPSKLPPEDDSFVEETFRKRGTISKIAREQVGDQDLRRLRPSQWLNDEIINFYGAMIMARAEAQKENTTPGVLKAFYLSTFFWHKLVNDGYDKGRLAKWTKKVDIFSQDVVLIPVNHSNAHWTAAAINFKKKRFESYDSMGMAKEGVWRRLREYVKAEHLNKKKKPFDFEGWVDWAPETTPQQENGFDCGVFTCQFLESLSRGEDDFIFTQKDMPYLRRRMVWEIAHARLRNDV